MAVTISLLSPRLLRFVLACSFPSTSLGISLQPLRCLIFDLICSFASTPLGSGRFPSTPARRQPQLADNHKSPTITVRRQPQFSGDNSIPANHSSSATTANRQL